MLTVCVVTPVVTFTGVDEDDGRRDQPRAEVVRGGPEGARAPGLGQGCGVWGCGEGARGGGGLARLCQDDEPPSEIARRLNRNKSTMTRILVKRVPRKTQGRSPKLTDERIDALKEKLDSMIKKAGEGGALRNTHNILTLARCSVFLYRAGAVYLWH